MKYNELSLGMIEAIVNKLGGMEGVKNLLSGDFILIPNKKGASNVWKTIKIGIHENVLELITALKIKGFQTGKWSSDMLNNPEFKLVSFEQEIQLVKMSVSNFGFNEGVSYSKICAAAKNFGLELCPREVGPLLRLQYDDQPISTWVRVAMDPIVGSDKSLGIFYLENDGVNLSLNGDTGNPEFVFSPSYEFVFCLRK